MKKLTLVVLALSIVALSFGQDKKSPAASLDKSKLQFNVGVGLSTWGFPFYLGADYWITEDITIGIEGSARWNLRWSYGTIGGSINGNYHVNRLLQLPDNVDLYGGLTAGPYITFGSYWSNNFHIGIGGQIGGRYKIKEGMWVHAELGGGSLSGAKIGLTFRR
jgi:outer membrane immunogenic protein